MAAADQLTELLPSLWRPQPGDRTLLAQWLAAVGQSLDGAAADAQHVLRAHWADSADAALWAAHYQADRRERALPPAKLRDARDFRELQRYPYVRDLARLAGLLDLPPWSEPASLRESVEEYRQRIADVLAAYRSGLTTRAALRRLVEAALPEDMSTAPDRRRRAFAIEEPVALRWQPQALVSEPAVQEGDRVAPLARFALDAAGTPAFVLQGVTADAIGAATVAPMVERYTPGAPVVGIGVAYTGTLAAGQALRLLPGRRSWLLRGAALQVSAAETAANADADPSANGPWAAASAAATLSAGRAAAAALAPDGSVWLLQRTATAERVRRYDGGAAPAIEADAPAAPLHALAVSGDHAWLAAESGLFRCPLWPEAGGRRWSAVAAVGGAVRALQPTADGGLWAGGAQGLWRLAADGSLVERRHTALDLQAFAVVDGTDHLATANALFMLRGGQAWRLDPRSESEDQPDWTAEAAPDNAMTSPLPPLRAIAPGPDGRLWLGTADGLACWGADADGVTRLRAFPDLVAGPVHALQFDERGLLWVAAEAGLFRCDGHDLAQHDFAAGAWQRRGAAGSIYPDAFVEQPRGHWRYERAGSRWLRFDAAARRFQALPLASRALASEPVAGLLIGPGLRAERGQWDGSRFTPEAELPAAELRLRIKASESRIVDGAAPYLPAPVAGCSWRYLQLEAPVTPPAGARPWWSREGQLFLPPPRAAALPGHYRSDPVFAAHPFGEGQFDRLAFAYPPSARLWALRPVAPAIGIRVRLFLDEPAAGLDPALAERVWQLVARARPAGVALQLMAEGRILKESTP